MADHSVGAGTSRMKARHPLMFCFGYASPEKSCFVVDLVYSVPTSCYVSECHEKG